MFKKALGSYDCRAVEHFSVCRPVLSIPWVLAPSSKQEAFRMPPCHELSSSQPQPCDEAVNCLVDSAGTSVQRPAAALAGATADRLERVR